MSDTPKRRYKTLEEISELISKQQEAKAQLKALEKLILETDLELTRAMYERNTLFFDYKEVDPHLDWRRVNHFRKETTDTKIAHGYLIIMAGFKPDSPTDVENHNWEEALYYCPVCEAWINSIPEKFEKAGPLGQHDIPRVELPCDVCGTDLISRSLQRVVQRKPVRVGEGVLE